LQRASTARTDSSGGFSGVASVTRNAFHPRGSISTKHFACCTRVGLGHHAAALAERRNSHRPALDAFAAQLFAGAKSHLPPGRRPAKEGMAGRALGFLYQMAAAAGLRLVFTTGASAREQSLVNELNRLAPDAPVLPAVPDLAAFLAVLKRAKFYLRRHRPAAFRQWCGAPTIALFGPRRRSMGAARFAITRSHRQRL